MAVIYLQPYAGPFATVSFPGNVAGGYPVGDSTYRSQLTPAWPNGTKAFDNLGNEYTAVKAGAAIAVNEAVVFNAGLADVRKSSATNQMVLGVADTAFASGDFGWLLTRGSVVGKVVGATAINSILASTATAGTLGVAVGTDLQGRGAVQITAEAGGLATIRLS